MCQWPATQSEIAGAPSFHTVPCRLRARGVSAETVLGKTLSCLGLKTARVFQKRQIEARTARRKYKLRFCVRALASNRPKLCGDSHETGDIPLGSARTADWRSRGEREHRRSQYRVRAAFAKCGARGRILRAGGRAAACGHARAFREWGSRFGRGARRARICVEGRAGSKGTERRAGFLPQRGSAHQSSDHSEEVLSEGWIFAPGATVDRVFPECGRHYRSG